MSRSNHSDQPCVQAHAATALRAGPGRMLHLLAGTGWGGAENMGAALHRLSLEHGNTSQLQAPPPVAGSTLCWAYAARARRRAFAPDLVHAQLATPGLLGAAWLIAGETPLVLTFQLLPQRDTFPRDYLVHLPGAWLLRAAARRRAPCTLVAVSEPDRERLSLLLPGVHIALVTNRPQPQRMAAQAERALPFPDGRVRLLSVGRLVEHKGFDRMLEALADARVRELPWHWLIVGEGPERAALARTIAQHGLTRRVQLLGSRPARGLYAQADLVLCPSRHEGAPLVPQEALMEGTSILLSSIATHRAFCGEAQSALLPEDTRAWPARLEPLLASAAVRGELRAAQAPLRQSLDPDALWREYAQIYALTLSRARSHA